MPPTDGKPDVLDKMDALLNRQRTGEPPQRDLESAAARAERAAIPILTDIVPEATDIPVLTEALPQTPASPPRIAAPGSQPESPRETPHHAATTDLPPAAHSFSQLEEFLVQELESRIALELTASLDLALNQLLERSREHIRQVVREAIRAELTRQPGNTSTENNPH